MWVISMPKMVKKAKKKKKTVLDVLKPPRNFMDNCYMVSAYYMCHNAAGFLRERGYPWTYVKPKAARKKKKKKGGK